MRKHRHHPEFTTAAAWFRFKREKKREPYFGRRAHGLTPRQAPAPTVLEKAGKRRRQYLHAAARYRESAA